MRLRNQSGQMIIETILIITILFSVTVFVSAQMRQMEFFSSVVSGPWQRLAGMVQNGNWQPPAVGAAIHPSGRVTSVDPSR